MIYLTSTTDTLELTTSAAVAIDVQANYVDAVASGLTPVGVGRQNTAISTATTTVILSAPGSGNVRTLKQLTVRNNDASLDCTVSLIYDANTVQTNIVTFTLKAGNELIYIEGVGFSVYVDQGSNGLLTSAESGWTQRILMPPLAHHGTLHTFLTISGTAYYTYIGRMTRDITAKYVEFQVTTAGAGGQTAEVGLYSTPNPPNKGAQTLTRLAATGTVDSLTATGVKRNTASFNQLVPAGTHLWAAMRTAMATTQPTCGGVASDMSQGHILTTTGGGALTGVSSASGALVAVATVTTAPYLTVTLD